METQVCVCCERELRTTKCSDCQFQFCRYCQPEHDCPEKLSLAARGHWVAGKEVKRGKLAEMSDELFLALVF
jgi:hypothetical protein